MRCRTAVLRLSYSCLIPVLRPGRCIGSRVARRWLSQMLGLYAALCGLAVVGTHLLGTHSRDLRVLSLRHGMGTLWHRDGHVLAPFWDRLGRLHPS